jgi:hypothetical protein
MGVSTVPVAQRFKPLGYDDDECRLNLYKTKIHPMFFVASSDIQLHVLKHSNVSVVFQFVPFIKSQFSPSIFFISIIMFVFRRIIARCWVVLALVGVSLAQDNSALQDAALGLQGLMEAGKDPALLVQLLKDMQVRCLSKPTTQC